MNRAAAKRLISKQEACVLLGDLDLTHCTETVESVSISSSKALRQADDKSTDKTFLTMYKQRPQFLENLSMHEFFHYTKNAPSLLQSRKFIVPHFVGVSGSPKFPVTENYAKHTLIVYRPWRKYPKDLDWIGEFNAFINSNECPASAKMPYEREMARHYAKMTFYEPKASSVDHSNNPIADDDAELMTLFGLQNSEITDHDVAVLKSLDRGLLFEWDKTPKVSHANRYGGKIGLPDISPILMIGYYVSAIVSHTVALCCIW